MNIYNKLKKICINLIPNKKIRKKLRKKINNNENFEHINHVWQEYTKKLIEEGYSFNNNIMSAPAPSKLKMKFFVESQSYIAWEVFLNYEYEFYNARNSILIDVGMNFATTTLYFAYKENVKKIYSFEPFIPTYNGALENIKLNPDVEHKIESYPFGLSNKNDEIKILYDKELAGGMSSSHDVFNIEGISLDKEAANIEKIQVKDASEMLQPILEQHKNEQIILKVDTEGAEFDIFESLDKSGLLNKIDIIILEHHFRSPKELENRLTKNNFVVFYKDGYKENQVGGMIYAVRNAK